MNLTFIVPLSPLSAKMYKWEPANLKLEVIPARGKFKYSQLLHTVEAPLTDTLVSEQLYLWPPCQNPITPIQTLYFHILISGQLQLWTLFLVPQGGCLLMRALTLQQKPEKIWVLWVTCTSLVCRPIPAIILNSLLTR